MDWNNVGILNIFWNSLNSYWWVNSHFKSSSMLVCLGLRDYIIYLESMRFCYEKEREVRSDALFTLLVVYFVILFQLVLLKTTCPCKSAMYVNSCWSLLLVGPMMLWGTSVSFWVVNPDESWGAKVKPRWTLGNSWGALVNPGKF